VAVGRGDVQLPPVDGLHLTESERPKGLDSHTRIVTHG
jgi:hypothetical protein